MNLFSPEDQEGGLGDFAIKEKQYEEFEDSFLKLFEKVETIAEKIASLMGKAGEDAKKVANSINDNGGGGSKLGLGSFAKSAASALGMGVVTGGAALMQAAPSVGSAVTQYMGAATYAGYSGMSVNQAIAMANKQIGGGATSAMSPVMAQAALASQGYAANTATSQRIMGQVGGLSAMTGMSNEQAAGAFAGINGMNMIRYGVKRSDIRDANGDLQSPTTIINAIYNRLGKHVKNASDAMGTFMNQNSTGYQSLSALAGGNQQLMSVLQDAMVLRAKKGSNLASSDLSNVNTTLGIMGGMGKDNPFAANFRNNSAQNKLLGATQDGLVQGYDTATNASAAVTEGLTKMAEQFPGVTSGLMKLKGILETFPQASGPASVLSQLGGGLLGGGANAINNKMLMKSIEKMFGKEAKVLEGDVLKAGEKSAAKAAEKSLVKAAGPSLFGRLFGGVKNVLKHPGDILKLGETAVEEAAVGAEEVVTGGAATPAAVAEEAAIAAQDASIAKDFISGAARGGPHDFGNLGTGNKKGTLNSSKFVLPVSKSAPITSPYGQRGGGKKTKGFHAGLDFGVKQGSPVYAISDGTVTTVSQGGGWGNYVVIDHGHISSRYAHLSSIMVSKNQKVKAGQVIARSGGKPGTPGAGSSTGPHLHLEVMNQKGVRVNPKLYLTGAGTSRASVPVGMSVGTRTASAPESNGFANFLNTDGTSNLGQYASTDVGSLLSSSLDGKAMTYADLVKKVGAGKASDIMSGISGPQVDDKMIPGGKDGLMKTLSVKGFKGKALQTAFAITLAESSGRPGAVGDVKLQDSKWGPSYGLFQVRSLKDWKSYNESYRDGSRLRDASFNAAAGYTISNKGRNFNPWSTYTSGSFVKYLKEAQTAANDIGQGGGPEGLGISTTPDAPSVRSSSGSSATFNARSNVTIKLDMNVHIAQGSIEETERLVRAVSQRLTSKGVLDKIASAL
jgi:murein DD-endopeptidase MepM/ murein hydrolase activator NlpD